MFYLPHSDLATKWMDYLGSAMGIIVATGYVFRPFRVLWSPMASMVNIALAPWYSHLTSSGSLFLQGGFLIFD